jgi:hypothetical protein
MLSQAPSGGQPSALDLARPRQPFAFYEQRGPGQLLFDMGVVSDFVGTFTQRNVDKANAGTFPGRENRFFPREVEINLFGRIDPYAEGVVVQLQKVTAEIRLTLDSVPRRLLNCNRFSVC